MKKRLLALFLVISMMIGVLSMTASASPIFVHEITSEGGALSESGTYVLTSDITITGLAGVSGSDYLEVYGADVVIDLNGYTLTGSDSYFEGISVTAGGSLTIIDSSAEGTGKITGGNYYVVSVYAASTFTLEGGTITGGNTGVGLTGGSTFVLDGGTVTGNDSRAVMVNSSTFIMNGGTLNGKIDTYNDAEVIINGGTVNGVSYDSGTSGESVFTDVSSNAYYSDSVDWAVEKGITTGTGDGTTFSPEESCTRGQVVTFLYRAAGEPEVSGTENPFSDVSSSDYYYSAVLWAVENGITTGTTSTTFSPNDTCTRGQVVTFLYRYAGTQVTDTDNPFTDVSSGDYYYTPVLWAVENGVTTGTTTTTFSPAAECTRGQVVTFLYRALAE